MKTLTKTVELSQTQFAFRQNTALFRGFVGGRGAGKTWIGSYDLLRRAKQDRTYVVVSPTYRKIEDETLFTLKSTAKKIGIGFDFSSSKMAATTSTGALIRFRSGEEPDKLAGPNLSGVWLDEASLMTQAVYTTIIMCLRESAEQGWLTATFTPKGKAHCTHEVFNTGKPNTWIIHSPTRNNPFLPSDF